MFDLITGQAKHLPRHQTLPMLVSTAAQAAAVGSLVIGSLVLMAGQVPEVPTMMAFVAAAPAVPPPPPPPPAAAKPTSAAPNHAVAAAPVTAPIEMPTAVEPQFVDEEGFETSEEGVEGGVPGGVVGGIVGGLVSHEIAPPPPPPPPAPKAPVRAGGQIEIPALVHRVEPFYPPMAVDARLQGVVILEATVDETGRVENVALLRSAGTLLDREAIIAVRQWRYTPLLLNGLRTRFVVSVTLSFHLSDSRT